MPTLPAPLNPQNIPERTNVPPVPPTPLSSSQPIKKQDSTIAAILFIISLLLLCGLIGIFVAKSTQTFRLDVPYLNALPAFTNKNTLSIEGTGPKSANIEISSNDTSYTTQSDKAGNFKLTIETTREGKNIFSAIARKKILFFKFESERSNEVFSTVDKTAPNLKLVSLPKLVTSSSYTLKGSTSEKSSLVIKINSTEHALETDDKNNFSFPIKLAKGMNSIVVTAKDLAGNETSTASLSINYATGSVYIPSGKNGKTIPNSSGELTTALTSTFGRLVAFAAIFIGMLGYMASGGLVTLFKFARHQSK